MKRAAEEPDAPLLTELARNDEQRQALNIISGDVAMGYPILTTPSVAPERLAALRKAFDATVLDPAFLADAAKSKLEIDPASGEQLQATAARINAEWTRNPLEIEAVAPFGSYMSRDERLAELPLAIVVRPRATSRRARWGRIATKSDGARDVRVAFRELSSFIRVSLVIDRRLLPRPFAIVFQER